MVLIFRIRVLCICCMALSSPLKPPHTRTVVFCHFFLPMTDVVSVYSVYSSHTPRVWGGGARFRGLLLLWLVANHPFDLRPFWSCLAFCVILRYIRFSVFLSTRRPGVTQLYNTAAMSNASRTSGCNASTVFLLI